MPSERTERIIEILARLVAFDTTSHKSNLALIDWIEAHLAPHGVAIRRILDPVLPKASLWVTIGPADRPGYILSGHTDVVPVDGQPWTTSPFELTRRGDRLAGRGATDMKGFLAVCLALVPEMASARLKVPIHLAISYDEEIGCMGVRPMLEWLSGQRVKPIGCFVGEPTGMGVVIGHKSKAAVRASIRGKAGHSSVPDAAVNAVEAAADLLMIVRRFADAAKRSGARDELYDVPWTTGVTSVLQGGTAHNIVPDRCALEFEFRGIAGDDPQAICKAIIAEARMSIEAAMRERDATCGIDFDMFVSYPALETAASHPIVGLAKELSGRNSHAKVAFGTEAGLFAAMAGIPSVVIGPGVIAQAHTADEFIEIGQLQACARLVERLIAHCAR